ncbi:alpha/beta fold hydrolase [Paenarthrobacter sp. NPDC089675]|uniref:alpha/beta fold hydrolase n=1 Tax=Paenarthrobacter TaxID=1742992 RepID=UPI0038135442
MGEELFVKNPIAHSSLHVEVYEPHDGRDELQFPPVLLIHGYASSGDMNWNRSGWTSALTNAGRLVITVDLPGHGLSEPPEDDYAYRPSTICSTFSEIVRGVLQQHAPVRELAPIVDVIGYSLGSRLAWQFAATYPELVRRLVVGAPSRHDPFADFDHEAAELHLTSGQSPTDSTTAEFLRMGQAGAGNDISELLRMIRQFQLEPFTPYDAVPQSPVLLVAGDRDPLAETMPELAALAPSHEITWLPSRNHTNAVSSRTFKNAAIKFLS